MDNAITPQMIRNAAALATEAGSDPTGQAAVDVFHVVKNRLKHGGYGNSFDELWTRGMNGGPIQFEGVTGKRSGSAFLNIRTLEEASKWSGYSIPVLRTLLGALTNPTMQQKSASHVGRALEFRGSPKNHMRLENTAWRGTDNDNQFLTGSEDPLLSLALYNKILPKTKPTSTNSFVERADARLNKMLPPGAGETLDWKPLKIPQIRKTEKKLNPLQILGTKLGKTLQHSLQILGRGY